MVMIMYVMMTMIMVTIRVIHDDDDAGGSADA